MTVDNVKEPWTLEPDRVTLALLGKLCEECGELTAIASRCIIQGVGASEPVTGVPNREALMKELADVRAMVDVLAGTVTMDVAALVFRVEKKRTYWMDWREALIRVFSRSGEEKAGG